jgi:hypothetical protein
VRTRRIDIYIYASAVAAVGILGPPVPLYWDSFGYVVQAITGQVGGLGLGRPVFVLLSHALAAVWFRLGGSATHLEPILRMWWAMVAALAAPLTWRLARRAGLTYRASALAGLAVAVSPAMAHVGGSVLTDGPATAMCVLASLLGVQAMLDSWDAEPSPGRRALALAAGAGVAIGVGIGLREQSILGAAGLALLLPIARREDRLLLGGVMAITCVLVVAVPMLVIWLTEPGYSSTIRTWLLGMAHDRAAMTFGWRDAGLFALWILSLGPVVAVAAAFAWGRPTSPVWRAGGALFAISAPALVQLAVTIAFRGISYSPRFMLPAFPGAIAIPGAWAIDRWIGRSRRHFVAACLLIVMPLIVAAPIVGGQSAPAIAAIRTLPELLAAVPPTAVIVTGQPCPEIAYQRTIVAHDVPRAQVPDWQPVCPGWAWPNDLAARFDAARRDNRVVVLDLRPTSWLGAEQQAALREITAYAFAPPTADRPRLILWR